MIDTGEENKFKKQAIKHQFSYNICVNRTRYYSDLSHTKVPPSNLNNFESAGMELMEPKENKHTFISVQLHVFFTSTRTQDHVRASNRCC